jgi:protein-tyrosine phosphatase
MHQVTPHLLWLGHARDVRNVAALYDSKIEAVVQLAAEEPTVELPRDLVSLRIPLHDGTGNLPTMLRLAVESIATLVRDRRPTLVACGFGLSRSPAVACFGLVLAEQASPAKCLEVVHRAVKTDISPGLWKDLIEIFEPNRNDSSSA